MEERRKNLEIAEAEAKKEHRRGKERSFELSKVAKEIEGKKREQEIEAKSPNKEQKNKQNNCRNGSKEEI